MTGFLRSPFQDEFTQENDTRSQGCVSSHGMTVAMVQLREGNGTHTLASGTQSEMGFDLWKTQTGGQ